MYLLDYAAAYLENFFEYLVTFWWIRAITVRVTYGVRWILGVPATVVLVWRMMWQLIEHRATVLITGGQRYRAWPKQAHRMGFPARWMILSWIMLSNYTVGMMLGCKVDTALGYHQPPTRPVNYQK